MPNDRDRRRGVMDRDDDGDPPVPFSYVNDGHYSSA